MTVNSSTHAASYRSKQPVAAVFMAAVWFGLLTGLVEVGIVSVEKFYLFPMRLSRDFVWMAPLAEVALSFLAGLFFFSLSRLWSKFDPVPPTIFVCSTFAFMNLLILIPRLLHYAALLLAAGLAVQTTRFIRAHAAAFQTLVRRTVVWMLGFVAVLALSVQGWQRFVEHRALAALPPAPANASNVLLITLDTVRAPNMSLYGYHRPTTPELERFAETGVVFERALSTCSWTLPSHASIFTGRWPFELSTDWRVSLDKTCPTLAEFFRAHGYLTAGFVANTGYCSYESGLNRGFAHYDDYRITAGQIAASSTLVRTIADNFRLRRLIRNDEHLNRKPANQMNETVLRWLAHQGQKPFFIFLNYYDAHEPYLPPPPFDRKFGLGRKHGKYSPLHRWNWDPAVGHGNMNVENTREEMDAYDGALAYIDYQLGLLFAELRRRDLINNTLIIITADHGEEFGEHGVFDHGNSLYRPTLQVPLLISFPSRVPQGKRIETPVSLRDLPATVVDLVCLQPDSPFPGQSLSHYWENNSNHDGQVKHPLYAEVNHAAGHPAWFPVSKGDMKSLVFDGMRYIKNGNGEEELYDFDSDPWEKRNLAKTADGQHWLAQLRTLLDNLRAASPVSNEASNQK